MAGQRVFITGASSGLGEGLARHYGRAGAVIGLVARRAAMLESLATTLRGQGATVHVYAGDVADTAFMTASASAFVEAAGGVDLVIANAGVGVAADAPKTGAAADVAWMLGVNVIGVTNTIVPFVPTMLAQKSGVLCAVSSVAGHRALPGRTAYSASKVAVTTFMSGLRMDLHGSGVHAMTLCPGYVTTPLTAENEGMIFVIDVDRATAEMTRAIAARATTFTFPWPMRWLSVLLRHAPEGLVRRLAPPGRRQTRRSAGA